MSADRTSPDAPLVAVDGPLSGLGPDVRALLLDREAADAPELRAGVVEIMDDVRSRGDEALRDMARTFDGVELEALEVPRARWREALDALDRDVRRALEHSARNVRRWHEEGLPPDVVVEVEPGVRLGRRAVPLASAGVYAPGGRAAYPSSVVMGVVPARTAGVGEVVVCSPPGPSGSPPPAVLAAAEICGADRLFAVGGAGAVAALTWGTASVPAVDAVVGPGNRWVTEAKRRVAGEVVVDAPAGPSEVLVVAEDEATSAGAVVAELLAQAEHDPEAAVALVTPSGRLLDAVRTLLPERVASSVRAETIRAALRARGALLRTDDLGAALDFADRYAPEHLALHTRDPARDLERVRTAGTAFLGRSSSVAFGDYVTGANHVLPTAGAARRRSGLSALTFLRFQTWQEVAPGAARRLAVPTSVLAEAEGLPSHARAARTAAAGAEAAGAEAER